MNYLLETALGRADHLSANESRQVAVTTGMSLPQVREILLAYAMQRQKSPLISGHYFFSERLLRDTTKHYDCITILREPRARLLSAYYYNRFKTNREHFGIDMDLENWLRTPRARHSALLFTRMFVGDLGLSETLCPTTRPEKINEAVNRAIANLQTFSIVGTLESYTAFEHALCERYGLDINLKHLNTNPALNYPTFADQPANIQSLITALCAADSRVYEAFSIQPVANL